MNFFPPYAVQYPWEWYTLARVLKEFGIAEAKNILEIGLHDGGSMQGWMHLAPEARYVGVDLDVSHLQFIDVDTSRLTKIQGNSQDPAIIHSVRIHGPFDFIFIDGDHSYLSVQADFENYKDMLTPDGIMGFHDVSNSEDCGTWRFWHEIQRAMYHTITVSCTTKMGVGLILDGCAHE